MSKQEAAGNANTCPEVERLAALAEGRLAGAERSAALAHVAGCSNCYELFVEIRRSLDELALAPAAAPQSEPPTTPEPKNRASESPSAARRPPGWRLLALAAGVGVVFAAVYSYYGLAGGVGRPPSRQMLMAGLSPPSESARFLWGGLVERSAAAIESPLARDSAEIGALLLDLDLALAAGDGPHAARVARRFSAILATAGLLPEDAAWLSEVAKSPEAHFRLSSRRLDALEERLRQRFLPFFLDLGAFAEAARVASLKGESSLLADADTREYLDWLLEQDDEPLSATQREALLLLAGEGAGSERALAAERLLQSLTR